LDRLVVQHARLPRLLDGFQPVEDGRGDRDRVLEPPRHNLLLFRLPKEILPPFGRRRKRETPVLRRGLRGYENLVVGAAVEGDPVAVSAQEHGVPGAPVLFRPQKDQLISAIFARQDDLLLE
jgi:hypothetical protein